MEGSLNLNFTKKEKRIYSTLGFTFLLSVLKEEKGGKIFSNIGLWENIKNIIYDVLIISSSIINHNDYTRLSAGDYYWDNCLVDALN